MQDKVYIFGHQNPDTDSVTSSIALSYLKNHLGLRAEARILGDVNKETKFVLDYFKVKTPSYLDSVKLQIKNVDYYKGYQVFTDDSILNVYTYLKELNITGAPVVDHNNILKGVVTSKDILKKIIENNNYIDTTYDNVKRLLNGVEILKFSSSVKGKITKNINDKIDDNKVVILENINDYINTNNINTIIVINNHIDHEIIKELYLKKINVIYTKLDILSAFNNLILSDSIINVISKEQINMFNENYYYYDFLHEANKLGHNNYPVINKNRECLGLIRITDKNEIHKKKVILVDHNEAIQSVDGIEEADIIEIVDHHKIGSLSTNDPINFRNMSVGSTNTIIYEMYKENHVIIPYYIAGIMLSGILSDTLGLTGSTTTEIDKEAVLKLSNLLDIDYKNYYKEMLQAGTSIDGLTKLEVLTQDYKTFQVDDKKYAVGVMITLDIEQIMKDKDEYLDIMEQRKNSNGLKLMLFVITDVINNGSYILYTEGAEEILKEAFNLNDIYQGIFIDGITSRKKQVIPNINSAIK